MTTSFNLTKLAQSISSLVAEANQIISRLGKNAKNDPRFQEITLLLGKKGERGEEAADALSSKVYFSELVPEQDSSADLASERGQVSGHWSVNFLGKLNQVAYSKKAKVLNDIYQINTEPYSNCGNISALRWVQYNAGRKGHNKIYREAIERVGSMSGNIFEMDDFFGYHPPIVATYYALHPEILKQISESMYSRMLAYGINIPQNTSDVRNRIDFAKYQENVLQNWGALSSNRGGIPLHWTTYRDDQNKSFTFGQMLIQDFTKRLADEDPEAMCILFEKLYRYVTLFVSKEMSAAKSERKPDEESSDILDSGKSDFSSAQSDLVGNEQKRQTMESNLQYALDETVFSNGEKSFQKQIEFLEKYLTYFNSLLSVMDRSRDPDSHKIILGLKNDLESAMYNFVNHYVDALNNAYKYSLESRTNKGVTVLDLSFDKMIKMNARKEGKYFVVKFAGENGYTSIVAKFVDNGKKIKKQIIDIATGNPLGVDKELSLIEFEGLDLKISPKHMISLTKQEENESADLFNSLGDIFEMYGDLNTPAENKKISQDKFQQMLYSVRPELIEAYRSQNSIPVLASICRNLFYENPELIDKVIAGIKNTGSKSLSPQEKILDWKKSFPEQYSAFENSYLHISNHIINKIQLLRNKINLTDEAIECFDTIGHPALVSEINKLKTNLKSEPDPGKKQEILNLIGYYSEAQKVFNNLFSGIKRSDFKSPQQEVNVSAAWLGKAIKVLWNEGEIADLIDEIDYRESIRPQIASYIKDLDDLQVIDLAATAYRGLSYNLTKKECMSILPGMEKLLNQYGLQSGTEQTVAIFSLFSSSCPIDLKKESSTIIDMNKQLQSSGSFCKISDWIKAFGRKTYTE